MTHSDVPELPELPESPEASTPDSSINPPLIPKYRFWIPLLIQLVLIAAVPAQAIYTHLAGRTVLIQTAPVDPYDLLTGYSVTLSYDIARIDTLRKLPGWKTLPKGQEAWNRDRLAEGLRLYVILEAPSGAASKQPQAWKAVDVRATWPQQIQPNQIVLTGQAHYNSVDYGIETYYMPEARREEVNTAIRESQGSRSKTPAIVEAKVDPQGNAVPVQIWVNGKAYRF